MENRKPHNFSKNRRTSLYNPSEPSTKSNAYNNPRYKSSSYQTNNNNTQSQTKISAVDYRIPNQNNSTQNSFVSKPSYRHSVSHSQSYSRFQPTSINQNFSRPINDNTPYFRHPRHSSMMNHHRSRHDNIQSQNLYNRSNPNNQNNLHNQNNLNIHNNRIDHHNNNNINKNYNNMNNINNKFPFQTPTNNYNNQMYLNKTFNSHQNFNNNNFNNNSFNNNNFDNNKLRTQSFLEMVLSKAPKELNVWVEKCRKIAFGDNDRKIVDKYVEEHIKRMGNSLNTVEKEHWERLPLPYWLLYQAAPSEYNLDFITSVLPPNVLNRFIPIEGTDAEKAKQKFTANRKENESLSKTSKIKNKKQIGKKLSKKERLRAHIELTNYVKKILDHKNLDRTTYKKVCRIASVRLLEIFRVKCNSSNFSTNVKTFLSDKNRQTKIQSLVDKTIALEK